MSGVEGPSAWLLGHGKDKRKRGGCGVVGFRLRRMVACVWGTAMKASKPLTAALRRTRRFEATATVVKLRGVTECSVCGWGICVEFIVSPRQGCGLRFISDSVLDRTHFRYQ
jgi:hypothetical protein